MENDRGSLTAEFGNSRLKYWLITATLIILCVLGMYVYASYSHAPNPPYTILLLGCGLLILLQRSIPQGFNYDKMTYKAYENGLEISRIGYFVWDDVRVSKYKNRWNLFLKDGAKKSEEFPKPPRRAFLFATSYNTVVLKDMTWGDEDTKNHPHMLITNTIPFYYATMKGDDFFKNLKAQPISFKEQPE